MTSQTTKDAYIKQYNTLCNAIGSDEPLKLLKYIQTRNTSVRTKTNNLNSIIGLMKSGDIPKSHENELKKARDQYQLEIRQLVAKDNLGKYRTKVESVTIEHLDKMLESLYRHRGDDIQSAENYLLFSLMWPLPMRNDLMEITKCSNIKNKINGNCIYLPKSKNRLAELHINDHKTSTRGGHPIVKTLNSDQTQIARELFADGRTYLFPSNNGRPLSSSGLSNRLGALTKHYLGTPITATALRKIHWTHTYSDLKNQMNKDAKQMGQSSNVGISHYLGELEPK